MVGVTVVIADHTTGEVGVHTGNQLVYAQLAGHCGARLRLSIIKAENLADEPTA